MIPGTEGLRLCSLFVLAKSTGLLSRPKETGPSAEGGTAPGPSWGRSSVLNGNSTPMAAGSFPLISRSWARVGVLQGANSRGERSNLEASEPPVVRLERSVRPDLETSGDE
jgi:hypothetical protein